jgi:type III restriction enzyme
MAENEEKKNLQENEEQKNTENNEVNEVKTEKEEAKFTQVKPSEKTEKKEEEKEEISPLEDPSGVIEDLFPARPGVAAGNSLESLDNRYFSGGEIEYLSRLEDLVVMNDEAHHIHENKTAGEIQEVEWQKSLNFIAKNMGKSFIQIDFSATPYDTTGSGQKRTKHYFPHVIVDFDLNSAINDGLVKMITIDKRKELSTLELDFKALRDEGSNKVIGLSDGQKIMIKLGLQNLIF